MQVHGGQCVTVHSDHKEENKSVQRLCMRKCGDFLSYSRPRVGISREESVECDHVILSEQFTHPFTILVLSDGCMSSKTISSDTSNTCVEVTKQQTQPTTRDGGHALVHLHVESVRVMWCGHFTRCVLDDDVQYPSDSVML